MISATIRRPMLTMQDSETRDIAERTLRDLMHFWVGMRSTQIKRIGENRRLTEIELGLPSFFSQIEDFDSRWLLLVHDRTAEIITCPVLKTDCFRVVLDSHETSAVRDVIRVSPFVYLLLAFPAISIADLAGQKSDARFELYAVDVGQYFRLKPPTSTKQYEIFVPLANRLNLTTFTLLWASLWVHAFFEPIRQLTLSVEKASQTVVSVAFPKNQNTFSDASRSAFARGFEVIKPNLRAMGSEELLVRLNMGFGIQDIIQRLESTPDIDSIRTYCPEALQGTVSLWLFARFYHQFMKSSGLAVHRTAATKNIRYIPFKINERSSVPRVVRRAIILLQQYYRLVNVSTMVVAMPYDAPEKDRSFYGGGIGHFPWCEFPLDGKGVEVLSPSKIAVQESLEFLDGLNKQIILTDISDSFSSVETLGLRIDEVAELAHQRPLCLFAAEDQFIEHPRLLWLG